MAGAPGVDCGGTWEMSKAGLLPAEDAALRDAAHHSEQRALTALREHQDSSAGSNGEHGEH